ncbi:MAG: CidA/LrgA family protein [Oleiphilaceae bacterium]|nr:CidA/LrgA family protein [Oleiphilaceae bacterium]
MIRGLTVILGFQLGGMALAQIPAMPLPGAILGMLLFFVYLLVSRGGGADEQKVGTLLLKHLPLFFIPAGVGVMTFGAIITEQALALILALFLGTGVAFVVTAALMQWLLQREQRKRP